MSDAIDRRLQEVFDAVHRHAMVSEELDHEVGDLQDALKLAWKQLSPKGRRALHASALQQIKEWEREEAE